MLKLYGISSLDPPTWEDVDHEKEGPLAGTLANEEGGMMEEMDPLGMRGRLSGASQLDIQTSQSSSTPWYVLTVSRSGHFTLEQGFRPESLPLGSSPRCFLQ